MGVTHLTLDLRSRHECGNGIDDYYIDGVAADEHLGDLKRLLTRVRLRYEKVVDIDAELSRVRDV
jgi:hypothetical protein